MAVKAALDLADQILHDPLRTHLRGVFCELQSPTYFPKFGAKHCCTGDVIVVEKQFLELAMHLFTPGEGSASHFEQDPVIKLHVSDLSQRSMHFTKGVQIICAGTLAKKEGTTDVWFEDAAMCFRPELVKEMPWSALHMYSGSFSGWSQAMGWMSRSQQFMIKGQEVAVDCDDLVMKLWTTKHQAVTLRTPIEPSMACTPAEFVGICGRVEDHTILNAIRAQSNLVLTMSPPCQSWSRGGKQAGLDDANGYSFVEALCTAAACQPNFIAAECADELLKHPHWPLIKSLASCLGFKCVWSQATPYHSIVGHQRTRWLGVWVRADHRCQEVAFTFQPSIVPRAPWDHQEHELRIPKVWSEQLLLSPSECEFYNREDLLPQTKRARTTTSGPPQDTKGLWARVLGASDPMPTLCASYTRQHLLNGAHLQNKGIFAVLQHTSDGFRFFPPGLFVSMFGAVEYLVFPSKISATFQVLGNAITVPQSVLALAIGFLAITGDAIDPIKVLRQAWADRLTSRNCVIFHLDDFVHIVPRVELSRWILPGSVEASSSDRILCQVSIGDMSLQQSVHGQVHAADLFRTVLKGPVDLLRQCQLVDHDLNMHNCQPVRNFAQAQAEWQIFVQYCPIGTCRLSHESLPLPCTEVIEISPTMPFEPKPVPIRSSLPIGDLDEFTSSDFFLLAQPIIETLQDDVDVRSQQVTIVDQQAQISTTVLCSRGDQQHCLHQFCSRHPGQAFSLEHGRGLIIALLQEVEEPDTCPIVAFSAQHPASTARIVQVPATTSSSQEIIIDGAPTRIHQINGKHVKHCTMLSRGDFIGCIAQSIVVAGGHHQSSGTPPILRQGSNFEARIEFMTNTHGWLASDEMYAHTQTLMWMGAGIRASPPVMWDPQKDAFDDAFFGDPVIYNNAITLLPILVRSHWGAAEITKHGEGTSITLVQIHADFHAPVIAILARMMDIDPQRISVHATPEHYQPHLCGWNLLMRWFSWRGHHTQLEDVATQYHLPQNLFDAVELALQCSVEDWRTAGITREVETLALQLRKNFLIILAADFAQGRPSRQPMLQIRHPVENPAAVTGPADRTTRDQERIARIQHRLDHFRAHPGWLATDEMDYTLEGPRLLSLSTLFCAPAVWSIQRSELTFVNDLTPEYLTFGHIIWPIVVDQHWIMVELWMSGGDTHISATVPNNMREPLRALFDHLVHVTQTDRSRMRFVFVDQTGPPHLCGQLILQQIFSRLDAGQVSLSEIQQQRLATSQWTSTIALIQDEAQATWAETNASPTLRHFATSTRDWFLLRVIEGRFPADYCAAGVQDDDDPMIDESSKKATAVASSTSSKGGSTASKDGTDPWSTWDPWKSRPPRPQQAKWEDLQVRPPLPFHGSDGKPLAQTHRLQLTPTRGGVIFTTKSNVNEVIKANVQGDLVAILPAGDRTHLKHISDRLEGPFEITVDDPTAKLSYKRLINMLVIKGSVSFKLPEPVVKLTTAAICELVLEIDARLVQKQEFDKFRANPINTYKSHLAEISPEVADSAVLYGFRMIRYPGGSQPDQMMQVIAKIPFSQRSLILESSGSNILLSRDFLERGKGSSDTTVLPRFWPPSNAELQNMRIAVQGVQGFAGAVVTKRGLAPRIWVTNISAARSHLLATDSRLTKDNLHVVPKLTLELAGWPAATAAEHVISSTLQAIKLAVIPLRTFRVGGVHIWLVTTDAKPSQSRFAVQINSEVSEILVQEISEDATGKGGKGAHKGKSKKPNAPPIAWVPTPGSQIAAKTDDTRIDKLEQRFEKLEARQVTFETKVDSRFGDIQDSLRQLLAHAVQRPREPTGETPPPKIPKSS